MQTYTRLLLAGCAIFASGVANAVDIPAFPGAEGNGATTPGGRGGGIYLVTSLDDAGPGSLREACEAEGPRIVVVNVGGIIELESSIEIRHPFITIAGQAAPGDGVCLKNYGLNVSTHDVVIRYLRIRPGDAAAAETPGIGIANSERVIVDHCSISWTTGPAASVSGGSDDITLQWNMFTESLFNADPVAAKRGIGVSLAGESSTFSIHHNYFAHLNTGSPYISGAAEAPGPLLDFRNNVVYDWGERAGDSGDGVVRYNLVRNIYKSGPSTPETVGAAIFHLGSLESRVHYRENELAGSERGTANNFFLFRMPKDFRHQAHQDLFQHDRAFDAMPVETIPRSSALRRIFGGAGASKPSRDSADERLFAQYRLRVGALIGTADQVGGWPGLLSGKAHQDTDKDGMPDDWEREFGFSPSDRSDSAADADSDGYTNIEEFLNSTQPATAVDQ